MGLLKRSLRYRITGENTRWLQRIPVKNVSIFNRVDFILDQCLNKNVLHIGFSDAPFTLQKIKDATLLHLQLKKVTKSLLGLDNNETAISLYCQETKDEAILSGDILTQYPPAAVAFNPEIILVSEVLEHLDNPTTAIDVLYESFPHGKMILVTVPNCTSLDSLASSLNKTEGIHSDHHWYFSPYTLGKLFDEKKFLMHELHFGMYYLQHTKINNVLKQYPFNGDCIMAIFSIKKNAAI
jgi:uncharacterized protein YegP (UPF0339 family)